jgi:hypothetical protein
LELAIFMIMYACPMQDLEIISNGRHLQRQNSELNGQNSILALCTRADSNSINQPVSSFSGPFSTNAENSIFSRQHRKGEEYGRSMIKRFRPKGNRHMNQSAPRGFDQVFTVSELSLLLVPTVCPYLYPLPCSLPAYSARTRTNTTSAIFF